MGNNKVVRMHMSFASFFLPALHNPFIQFTIRSFPPNSPNCARNRRQNMHFISPNVRSAAHYAILTISECFACFYRFVICKTQNGDRRPLSERPISVPCTNQRKRNIDAFLIQSVIRYFYYFNYFFHLFLFRLFGSRKIKAIQRSGAGGEAKEK